MQTAIDVRAISQRVRSGVTTLRDISLTVRHGELVAIIGASGSGKTTLLDAMCGLRPPTSGSVIRSSRNVGYVPQDDIIPLALPLARALRYAAALREVSDPDAVDDALRALDLTGRSMVPVGHLTGGERKRASIASELLARPGLFFLDEPTFGLDPARGAELMRVLRHLTSADTAVVLTTNNPLDADRCDKVAVLAAGGHLVFFGTPAAAREYFGADTLDEIYERLAGVSDPVKAWSRRFLRFSRTTAAVSPAPMPPPLPGLPVRVLAVPGPMSAAAEPATASAPGSPASAGTAGAGPARAAAPPIPAGFASDVLRPLRQWALLTARNADVLTRARLTPAMLAGSPIAVLLMFLVLFRPGAFDPAHPSPAATVMISFWVAFGGFFFGLTYGLLQICAEFAVLRRERFAGLSAGAYVLAKAAVLLPLLAVVDLLFLIVLGVLGRLPGSGDYPATFVTLLLCSAAALGLGLLISAAVAEPSQAMIAMPIQVLFVGAILPLLASFGSTFSHAAGADWLILAAFTVAFFAATIAVVIRKTR